MPAMPKDSTQPGTNNELVIAYREHASKCFPMFTVYNQKQDCFDVIDGPEGFDAKKWVGTKIPNYDGIK
jgi:hypothetical protein